MPIHIENVTSDVTVYQGDLPLNAQQLEKLVQMVLRRLEEKEYNQDRSREATRLQRDSAPKAW